MMDSKIIRLELEQESKRYFLEQGGAGAGVRKLGVNSLTLVRVLLSLFSLGSLASAEDINVLILGSESNTRDFSSSSNTIYVGKSEAFNPNGIATELQSILEGVGYDNVQVEVLNRETDYGGGFGGTALIPWFYFPRENFVEVNTRWPNLRGEAGTDWDHVVIIGDPYMMENLPGIYAHGVAKVAEVVLEGGAEPMLLMPWPAHLSESTVEHYKEVVYRAGRSGGFKVAPAALAWQSLGSPADPLIDPNAPGTTPHPNADGAFICAASIYSRLSDESASASSNVSNNLTKAAMADSVHTNVTTNIGATHYTGKFTFQSPTLMKDDKNRFFEAYPRGTSTESGLANAAIVAHGQAGVTRSSAPGASALFTDRSIASYSDPSSQTTGFEFYYQSQTSSRIPHLEQIGYREISLANKMIGPATKFRFIPRRILWAEFDKKCPGTNPVPDGEHLSDGALFSSGAYMYTLVSGRCPLVPEPNTVTEQWLASKIGYEAAWNMGRCQTRAPGFQVLPSNTNRHTLDASNPEVMTVRFMLKPKHNVTVNISSSNPDVTVSPQTLTFTPTTHEVPQPVTVTPLASLAPGAITDIIYTTTSSDEVYHELDDSWHYHINTRPIAHDIAIEVFTGSSATVLLNGSDPGDYTLELENEALTFDIVTAPTKGVLTPISRAVMLYTPNAGTSGQDSFTYTVNDGSGISTPATAAIEITDSTTPYGINLVFNGDAELYPVTDYGWTQASWTHFRNPWGHRKSIAFPPALEPHTSVDPTPEDTTPFDVQQGFTVFQATRVATDNNPGLLYQNVDVSAFSGDINLNRQQFTLQGYWYTNGDDVSIKAECRDANDQVLSSYDSGFGMQNRTWNSMQQTFTAPANTTYIQVQLHGINRPSRALEAHYDSISLVALAPVTTYADWSNGASFSGDENGDGVINGIAWVSGAVNPSVDALALLPEVEAGSDPDYFVFHYRRSDVAHNDPGTTIVAQYSTDLQSWITAVHDNEDSNVLITEGNDVYGGGVDKVEVRIRRSLASGSGIFTRLWVSQ